MRPLFAALAVLIIAVVMGWLLQQASGGLVFTYNEWVIQTSLGLFILAFIVLFLLVYFLFWLVRKLIRLPADLSRWSEYRRRRRSEKFLTQGLLSMMEDNWPEAERAFRKGAAYSQTPLVNYLGAAQAAHRQGGAGRSDRYLRLAHRHDEASNPAVGLARARLQISQKQVEQAYHTLVSLNREQPGHDQVKIALLETAAEMKDWTRAAELLKECERSGLLPADQVKAKQLTFYAGLLQQAGAGKDRPALEKLWQEIPNKLKKECYLIEVYVTERLRHADSSDCEALLRRALRKEWDFELVRLFGLVEGKNLKQQLGFAEKYLARFPRDAALLLTLGRLCKKTQLWGKAKTYLEQSLEVQPNPEACQELATLLEQQGEHAAAAGYYQQGLNIATTLRTSGETADSLVEIKEL